MMSLQLKTCCYGNNSLGRCGCHEMRDTVEPLYNRHVGVGGFVRYKEVSFIGRLVQEGICNNYHVMKYK